MKRLNFPALAATLFLGTVFLASDATSSVCAFPPRSTHIIVENLSESDERKDGVTKLEHGLDLSRRDLAGVRITDVFLRDVDFSGSDLTGADLRYAQFLRCNFSNATLKNVAITDSGSFQNCDFGGAKLLNVDMTRVDESLDDPAFVECDFSGATLNGALSLNEWTFKDCVFKDVYLAGVRAPRRSSLDLNATANVKKYKEFQGFTFDDAPQDLFGFVLTRTTFLTDVGAVDFTDARLASVEAPGLSGRQLAQTVNFREKRYEGLDLRDANFEKYDFSDAVLTDCRFEKIDFANANFADAVLLDCAFRDVEGLTLEQLKSTWNWKSGRLDLISLDAALQAQIDAALAETQPDKAQDVANAKRAETAAKFDLAPVKYRRSYDRLRRYVPSNLIFDAIPNFRVASIERRYRADANGDALVSQRLNPENAVVVQGLRPPQERFVVELTGDNARTATLQIEFFANANSCRDRLLDVLAEDGEKRWRRGVEKCLLDDVYFIANGGDAPTSRLVFTCEGALFDLAFNDKTSLEEAEAVRRYLTATGEKASSQLNLPLFYGGR